VKRFISFLLALFLPLVLVPNNAWCVAAACSTAGGGSGVCYVDSASSGGNGTTTELSGANAAFSTLAAVYAVTYTGDDRILLKRGCTWNERLRSSTSGTSGHPITYDVYGAGEAPIIGTTTGAAYISHNYLTFNHLHFKGYLVEIVNGNNLIFNYCAMGPGTQEGLGMSGTNPSATLNNCTVAGNALSGIYNNSATGTLVVKNCIIAGNVTTTGGGGLRTRTGGTTTYYNSIITGSQADNSMNILGAATDGGGNLVEFAPRLKSGIYPESEIYFVLTSDDDDVAYWKDIASTLLPYGYKFTAFVTGSNITVGEQTDLANLAAAGHEVAVHGWSHSELCRTNAFAITSTNTNPTVNVDRANSQIILSCDEVGNRVTYVWTGNLTITGLKAAVAGKGWTITTSTNINDGLRLKSCADTAGAQTVPRTITLDVSAGNNYPFWEAEIGDNLTAIAGWTGVTPTTLAYPWGDVGTSYCAGLTNYLLTKGIIGARTTGATNFLLSNMNVYQVTPLSYTYFKGDGLEATVRKAVNHYVEYARWAGIILVPMSHSTTSLSIEQIGWIANELSKLGIPMVTFKQALTAIRSNHSTADNITYTKTYTDISDFHLQPNSPARRAGVDVGLSTDYAGRPVGNPPSIGAYEYSGGRKPMRFGGKWR
jgi:hypothetical protein